MEGVPEARVAQLRLNSLSFTDTEPFPLASFHTASLAKLNNFCSPSSQVNVALTAEDFGLIAQCKNSEASKCLISRHTSA